MFRRIGIFYFILGIFLLGFMVFMSKNHPAVSYYDVPLVEFSLKQQTHIEIFKCECNGDYKIRIKNVKINSMWETDTFINIQIETASGKQIVYYRPTSLKVDYKEGPNYYIDFSVPDMIPLNKELLLKVQILGESKRFFEINPNVHFEIVKCYAQ